jgi:hypothetical protein
VDAGATCVRTEGLPSMPHFGAVIVLPSQTLYSAFAVFGL